MPTLAENIIIDVIETDNYFLDEKNNICKEVIHSMNTKNGLIKICLFKKIDTNDQIDFGIYARSINNCLKIPKCIVDRMYIT